jgi:hypothetical protein
MMEWDLIRLLYVSTARADVTEDDVSRITSNATKANAVWRISGALAFNGTKFCQCLEGERENVHAMFEIIRRDARHSDITVVAQLEADNRYFDGWEMHWVFGLSFSALRNAIEVHPAPYHA